MFTEVLFYIVVVWMVCLIVIMYRWDFDAKSVLLGMLIPMIGVDVLIYSRYLQEGLSHRITRMMVIVYLFSVLITVMMVLSRDVMSRYRETER